MSLLMDALKKAEQERKEAAKRVQDTENELQVDQGAAPQQQEGGEDTGPNPVTPEDRNTPEEGGETTRRSTTQELSLAPLERESTPESDAGEEGEPQEPAQDNGRDTPRQNRPLSLPMESGDVTQEDPEMSRVVRDEVPTQPPLEVAPAMEVPKVDLDQTFTGLEDETPSDIYEETDQDEDFIHEEVEKKYDETLPGVPALQMAKDIGSSDQPTPVAAQTVFTAGNTTRSGSSALKWLLIGSGLVVILAGSVWYYYVVTPINRELPSPIVAKGIETAVPETPPNQNLRERLQPAPPENGTTKPVGPVAGTGAEKSAKAAAGAPESTAGTAAAAAKATPAAAEKKAPPAPAEPGAAPPAKEAAVSKNTAPAPPPAKHTGIQDLPNAIELSPALIRISRSKAPDHQGVQLKRAYAAYQAGNYDSADARYREVLDKRPDNRDALLGLGAVAMKRGDNAKALQIYTHLLKINPQDRLVRSILINLSKNTDPARSESTIKVMLQDNPDQPFLYFTLGNLYASQSRWPEAQQAFFDAYRQDSSNPDYAFNLAVSLDQLGHPKTALDYYKKARRLAGNGEASFDVSSLSARISTLEGAQ
jgi:Flp pilus assembly protein TadD